MSRHEQEKEYMVRLRDLGHTVGEYVGGGQGDGGEDKHHGSEPEPDVDTCLEGQNTEDSSENAHPLCSSMTVRHLVSAFMMTTS